MNLNLDFGQLLEVVSILGGVGLVLLKIGSKDQQFKDMIEHVAKLAEKQVSHAIEFGQVQNIVNGMLQMQKVSDQDREKIRLEVEDIFRRLARLEASKHKSITDT